MATMILVPEQHPALRAVAQPVTVFDDLLSTLANNMVEVMRDAGGVGIAAPQLGVSQRVIACEVRQATRRDQEAVPVLPLMLMVNPTIEAVDDSLVEGWEGCLSIPGYRGLVPRWQSLRWHAFDLQGNPISGEAEGFIARIIQHEVDHLNGVLYPDRATHVEPLPAENPE